MTVWTNDDGLRVRFGASKSAIAPGGEVATEGDLRELVLSFNGTDVPATASQVPITEEAGIPSGAYIESATLYVTTAFVGATATLDLGLWYDDGDGTYTVVDADGIDAAIAITAIDAADDKISCDGALIGTTVTDSTNGRPILISTGYGTAAFTAGVADLVIRYRV